MSNSTQNFPLDGMKKNKKNKKTIKKYGDTPSR